MSSYLVTGGAGFIGSNIVEALVRQGEFVRVLDDCCTGSLSNLGKIVKQIEFTRGDIRDVSTVRKAVEDMDYVIHQAAACSAAQSIDDPMTTNEINITGTLNVLIAARESSAKRVVYAGSASAYGNSQILPKREDMPVGLASPYAISKYAGEQYCRAFYDLYDLEIVVLRYFNVFGPRQDPNSQYAAALPNFINELLEGRPPKIFGDGEQSRDFIFVENVVRANLLACHVEHAAGEIFNIAYGRRTTINCLVKMIKSLIGSDIDPVYEQERIGDVRHSQADIGKARKILGYEPLIDLETGLEKTIKWLKANRVGSFSYS